MRRSLSALAIVSLAAGCTVEVPGWPMPPGLDGIRDPEAEASAAAPASDGSVPVAPKQDASGQTPKSCPALEGAWGGSCVGKITGAYSVEVTGTISLTLKPAADQGDFVISAGEWTSVPKGMTAFKTTQTLTGTVRCGVFETAAEVTILGVKSVGKISCVFDANGCNGTWTGKAVSGSSQGTGSFELRRK